MGTKWKNNLLLAVWLILLTFSLNGLSSLFLNPYELIQEDYFETKRFASDYQQFIDYLTMFEINYLPKEEVVKKIDVSTEEINEHRYRYGDLASQIADIKTQYQPKIEAAQQVEDQELADIYTAERDAKIEDITNNFKSDEYVKPKVFKEKEQKVDEYYRELESMRPEYSRLKSQFVYYLKDTATGELYTNLKIAEQANLAKVFSEQNMLMIRNYPSKSDGTLTVYNNNFLGFEEVMLPLVGNNSITLEGKIGVPKSAPAGPIINSYRDFQQNQQMFFIILAGAVAALSLSIYLYNKKILVLPSVSEKWRQYYNRLPLDVSIAVFIFFVLLSCGYLTNYYIWHLQDFIVHWLINLIHSAVFLTLTLMQGKLLYQRISDKNNISDDWRNSITCRIYQGLKETFLIRSVGIKVLLLLMIVFVFGAGMVVAVMEADFFLLVYFFAAVFIGLPLIYLLVNRVAYYNRIVLTSSELAKGNLEPDLPVKGRSSLAILAGNINALKYGVKTSQQEQAKSERLKTELITNVSHDLRTPLTSIISYTELLKSPDLPPEDRQAYIEIIDRKSQRLKVLIEDLFEASKMASGSVELKKEKVDLVQLLQQALAEHEEKISASTLQFRITKPDHPVYVQVDGQKIWRVFDNLIANILKYGLENTRVYITMTVLPHKVRITFKNITKYELGEDVNELFERFKRGDKSRKTEGSGLGLAIAKSIVDLHQGSLDIDLDGDLFKITITLPIS